ncbi:ribonuclease H-like domain-containing protein [Tanacetum coccineum]|uniref:Ribonuclease H-like domain-containing protein n=1 Tax=Tanacetum coccineum TaxID=301880 RepID=A0ABQ5GV42_9ASTR
MMETMEHYMSKTRGDYGSGVTRPTINQDTHFELKGQFLKELCDNTFSGLEHEDTNKHIEKQMAKEPATRINYNLGGSHLVLQWARCPNSTNPGLKGTRSTETSDGLAAIQGQLSNLGREIKKVNEKVYAAQVRCELCKGPHYTKDCPQKEEGKILEEAYYTQFGAPYQPGGRYRAEKKKTQGALPYLVDLGASVSVMPFSTYTNLGLGILSHTRLTIELDDPTIKQPMGIAKNVLARIGKFIFPIDLIILDIPEDDDVPLILGRPFLSTAHSKIDVFKRKITLRVRVEKLVFKSVKPATSIIKKVFVIKSLDSKTKLIEEYDESFNPTYGNYIELNDLDTPLETKMDQDFEPTFVKTDSYKMKFSCVIGYKYVIADLLPFLSIKLMSKSFYYSTIKDKDEGKNHVGTLINIPVFVGSFSIISGFTIIDDDDMTKDVVLGMKFCKKYASCQMIMKKFALGDKYERIMEVE